MSQTNGNLSSHELNHINTNNSNDCENDFEVFKHLERLVPAIKQNFILISQQFTEFINYTHEFDKLSSTIRLMQIKQDKLEKELEQYRQDHTDLEKQLAINIDDRVYLDVDKWNVNTNSPSNPIFIDRDGRLFDFILKYLRTGEINVEDRTTKRELLIEARYYKLKNLEDDLNILIKKDELTISLNVFDSISSSPPCSPIPLINRTRSTPFSPTPLTNSISRTSSFNQSLSFKSRAHPSQTASTWRSTSLVENHLNAFLGSSLLTNEYEDKLLEFIGADILTQIIHQQPTWRLIFRASEHGFDAADFHRCCDSYSPTVSIIQTDFGNIFGGFTTIPWSSASQRTDQADPLAFLFTLKNTLNIPPTKFPVAKEYQQCAISHNPTCGPNFGSPKNEGSDLCLRNKFNEKTNCIFFPKSYTDPTNLGGSIFAKKYFACKEVEVFTLMNTN